MPRREPAGAADENLTELQLLHLAGTRLYPEVLAKTAPRRYAVPPGYLDPRSAGAVLAQAVYVGGHRDNPLRDGVSATTYLTACRLVEFKVPTYFVGRELLAAVRASEPPEGLLLQDLRWPLEALLFMLPEGAVVSSHDGPCPFVAIAHHPPGSTAHFPGYDYLHAPETLGILSVTAATTNGTTFTLDPAVTDGRTVADLVPEDVSYDAFYSIGLRRDATALGGDDKHFLKQIVGLALRLVMVMAAQPELVERGGLARAGKKGKAELWSPNFVGRAYRLRREGGGEGNHASPRLHWRRGHWRHQAVGPREAPGHKLLWIEPVLVGAAGPEHGEGSAGAGRRG